MSLLLVLASARADEVMDINDAFSLLNSTKTSFPNGRSSPSVRQALSTLRAHPDEAKELLVKALSKGGNRGRPDVESLATVLLSDGDKINTIRRIVSTYDPGELDIPFLGYFACHAEKQDIPVLIGFISSNPDNIKAIELAKVMVEGDNPNAHAALHSLAKRVSGKWQESLELKKFFAKEGENSPSAASVTAVTPPIAAPPLAPNNAQPKPTVSTPVPSKSTEASAVTLPPQGRGWLWGVGGTLLAAVIFLIFFRKAKG